MCVRDGSEAEAQVVQVVARSEELRPPENRLAQCLGRLANRTTALTKLQADLTALDSQRTDKKLSRIHIFEPTGPY